ncbi:MAG: hypothetical protein LUQ61_01170 [Methanoregulaceae archaeon]|jgi:hypothetical protein|nr:hypothetical protein [Methanoregulaceae archaeon]
MKKFGIILLVLSFLAVGIALADPGIPKVNEVQGLTTSTTVIAAGNFNAGSSVDLTISSVIPVTSIPGPEWNVQNPGRDGRSIYQTVYTEDTQNSEVGFISYDKDLDVSTGNKVSGQYNVQAVKQITYLGVDASSVVTNDYLLLDGSGFPGDADERLICPFAGEGVAYPAFCNRLETGSAMNLKVANLNTQMGDRFIMKAADSGVEVFNNVAVGSYATDLPSKGSVSAYMKGSIKEGGRMSDPSSGGQGARCNLYETVTFSDSTAISGDISTFAKAMSYKSVIDTSGDLGAA